MVSIDIAARPTLDARTLIVGLGETGLSCARYLARNGVPVAVADSREQPPGLAALNAEIPDAALFLGPFREELFCDVERLVVSPGVPVSTPAVRAAIERGVEVIGDIELFAWAARAPVVAITGSNGKSTVTTLLGEMVRACGMRVAVGGNLGVPALDLLDDEAQLYVLELSSFQLEPTHSLRAAVAAVLNVSADHMDRYADLASYAAAKARIYRGAGVGVFNADDPIVCAMRGVDDAWCFTLAEPRGDKRFGVCNVQGSAWLGRAEQPLLPVSDLRMPGRHNRANALAALAMGTVLGLDLGTMLEVLRRFSGLPHRTELVAEAGGVRWFNDSKATNVGATLAALRGLEPEDGAMIVLIAGGQCKDADFSALGAALGAHVRAVVLLGEDADEIARVVPPTVACARVRDMAAAVDAAARVAVSGDLVLLSPACASFDMFEGYADRGDCFKREVRRLAA